MQKAKMIAYWITTIYVTLAIFYGGFAEVLDASVRVSIASIGVVGVVQVLGYPLYFLYIIGTWKMLGAIAILVPRFTRLKVWAYAGIFLNMSGALVSWLTVTVYGGVQIPAGYGSPIFHVVNALHLIVIALVSWALRPQSRRLGNILPTGIPQTVQYTKAA
jgi:uncharacterized membrane protein YphA (DoxX/SURF4 family)